MDWRDLGTDLVAVYHLNRSVDALNHSLVNFWREELTSYSAKFEVMPGRVPLRGPAEAPFVLEVAIGFRVICLVNLDVKR